MKAEFNSTQNTKKKRRRGFDRGGREERQKGSVKWLGQTNEKYKALKAVTETLVCCEDFLMLPVRVIHLHTNSPRPKPNVACRRTRRQSSYVV